MGDRHRCMRDSPRFTIFSSIAHVKTPSRHKITIHKLAWRCLCRFRGTASLPIAEGSVKTWKSFNMQFGTCDDILISALRGCACNSNIEAKELTHMTVGQPVYIYFTSCIMHLLYVAAVTCHFAPLYAFTKLLHIACILIS